MLHILCNLNKAETCAIMALLMLPFEVTQTLMTPLSTQMALTVSRHSLSTLLSSSKVLLLPKSCWTSQKHPQAHLWQHMHICRQNKLASRDKTLSHTAWIRSVCKAIKSSLTLWAFTNSLWIMLPACPLPAPITDTSGCSRRQFTNLVVQIIEKEKRNV